MGKRLKRILISIGIIIVLCGVYGLYILNYIPHRAYTSSDFGIEVVVSDTDYDNDGIDDYSDILQGAKLAAEEDAYYLSAYYDGGYPPSDEGVCTDVVWRSIANAGYDLKALIDEDIASNTEAYTRVWDKADPNIDFRRVPNQQVYFERHAESLTTDLDQIEEWMPGDIVVFSDNHIGIISDKRNHKGIPFIIHSGSNYQLKFEEDKLEFIELVKGISGHYRFNLN